MSQTGNEGPHDPSAGPAHPDLPVDIRQHVHEEGSEGWLVSYADMMTLLVGFFVILLSFSSIDQGKLEALKRSATKEFGGTYEAPYGDVADRISREINKLGLGDQFAIKQNEAGVEISFLGTVFFDTGSADFKTKGQSLLNQLVPVIKAESSAFTILIEGHTDDVPIARGLTFKTNWELSSVRACRVLDAFEKAGFNKDRLTAIGFGDARPVVPNRTAAGAAIPENQNQNRRVLIKMLKDPVPAVGTAPSVTDKKISPVDP